MRSKVFSALSIVALFTIVGVMSWRDMHPTLNKGPVTPVLALLGYQVNADIPLQMIPDDSTPLTIYAGRFNGGGEWVADGMAPTIFAQRQVNLRIGFEALSANSTETLKKIQVVVQDWERQGNILSDLYLDYRPENPDFKTYADLLQVLHAHFKSSHRLIVAVDTDWDSASLQPLQSYVALFLAVVLQPDPTPEILSQLGKFGYGFSIQFPTAVMPAKLDIGSLRKNTLLVGVVLTLDPHKPLPQNKKKIPVLPRF